MTQAKLLSVLLLFACSLGACSRQLIPNTDLDDTWQNRELIEFCERYRKAVEKGDVDALLSMAHPDYYEDGGNVDATDDLDYAGLRTYLNKQFVKAHSIRYEIHYRRITQEEGQRWNVAYTYSASYRLPDGGDEVWHREVADNQLTLVPTDDTFLILSGM